jgi:hypothetical protein
MAGEIRAQQIIQKELKSIVSINDDGSKPGMYDLRIGPIELPAVAIECVGAVDPVYAETWNIGPARGPMELKLNGDWIVTISVNAQIKTLRKNLGKILKKLESKNRYDVIVDIPLQQEDITLYHELEMLRINSAMCYMIQGTGKVHLTLPGSSGMVDERGKDLPNWIGEFIRDPIRKDVLLKLKKSGAKECHVFVYVESIGAPWCVESYLMSDLNYLPQIAPDLPSPVSGVWILSTNNRKGIHWNEYGWRIFDAFGEGID